MHNNGEPRKVYPRTLEEALKLSLSEIDFIAQSYFLWKTHPKSPVVGLGDEFTSVLTRLLIISGVTAIDRLIEVWRGKGLLEMVNDPKLKNGERVQALAEDFKKSKVDVDTSVLNAYLWIKHLRNAFVHVEWFKGDKIDQLPPSFFPKDVGEYRGLNGELLYEKVLLVLTEMLGYFKRLDIEKTLQQIPQHFVSPEANPKYHEYQEATYLVGDLYLQLAADGQMTFRNLVRRMIWKKSDFAKLCHKNIRLIASMLKNLEESDTELARHVVLESWDSLVRNALGQAPTLAECREASETFERLIGEDRLPQLPIGVRVNTLSLEQISEVLRGNLSGDWLEDLEKLRERLVTISGPLWQSNLSLEEQATLLQIFLPGTNQQERVTIARSLDLGFKAYSAGFMSGYAISEAFADLAAREPDYKDSYVSRGLLSLELTNLAVLWYIWVESVGEVHHKEDFSRNLEKVRQIREKLNAQSSTK